MVLGVDFTLIGFLYVNLLCVVLPNRHFCETARFSDTPLATTTTNPFKSVITTEHARAA